jgi:hypothetical protein
MKQYLVSILTLGALAFSVGIPLTPAHAKDVSAMGLHASSSELSACPSLFRCVVK